MTCDNSLRSARPSSLLSTSPAPAAAAFQPARYHFDRRNSDTQTSLGNYVQSHFAIHANEMINEFGNSDACNDSPPMPLLTTSIFSHDAPAPAWLPHTQLRSDVDILDHIKDLAHLQTETAFASSHTKNTCSDGEHSMSIPSRFNFADHDMLDQNIQMISASGHKEHTHDSLVSTSDDVDPKFLRQAEKLFGTAISLKLDPARDLDGDPIHAVTAVAANTDDAIDGHGVDNITNKSTQPNCLTAAANGYHRADGQFETVKDDIVQTLLKIKDNIDMSRSCEEKEGVVDVRSPLDDPSAFDFHFDNTTLDLPTPRIDRGMLEHGDIPDIPSDLIAALEQAIASKRDSNEARKNADNPQTFGIVDEDMKIREQGDSTNFNVIDDINYEDMSKPTKDHILVSPMSEETQSHVDTFQLFRFPDAQPDCDKAKGQMEIGRTDQFLFTAKPGMDQNRSTTGADSLHANSNVELDDLHADRRSAQTHVDNSTYEYLMKSLVGISLPTSRHASDEKADASRDRYEELPRKLQHHVDMLRLKIAGMPRRKLRGCLANEVTLEEIEPLMGVNRDDLATMLSLGVTTWKSFVHQELGIARWPARSLKSATNKAMDTKRRLQCALREGRSMDAIALRDELHRLSSERMELVAHIRASAKARQAQQSHRKKIPAIASEHSTQALKRSSMSHAGCETSIKKLREI